ncbi:MAG: hypothetical protein ABIC91_05855 [Nanoarchaeota archaeon]|nr:hypothetical protein [Nanoarchaeota archaeon]MBU1030973.1 hypothetical protein [Nanoarchaeota archaeon]MBU1850162.1 hypothetical protein [Nanoarchaeota archaeon]
MTDITNKITVEETEAYIESVEKELKQKDHSMKYVLGSGCVMGSSILLVPVIGLSAISVLFVGSLMFAGSIYNNFKQLDKKYLKIKQTRENLEQLYK